MALDGITVANIVSEMNALIQGARISKIAQPEADELMLTVKTPQGQKRVLLSASASLPLVYLTQQNKLSPMKAPNFFASISAAGRSCASGSLPSSASFTLRSSIMMRWVICGGRI